MTAIKVRLEQLAHIPLFLNEIPCPQDLKDVNQLLSVFVEGGATRHYELPRRHDAWFPNVMIVKIPTSYPVLQIETLVENMSPGSLGCDHVIVLQCSEANDVTVEQLKPTVSLEQLEQLLRKYRVGQ